MRPGMGVRVAIAVAFTALALGAFPSSPHEPWRRTARPAAT